MNYCRATCFVIAAVVFAAPSQVSGEEPAPAPTPPAASAANAEDLQKQLLELSARLEALEAKHAEERVADQKRIAELEATVRDLQGKSAPEPGTVQQPIATGEAAAGGEGANANDELAALIGGATEAQPEVQPSAPMGTLQSAIQSFNPDISINGDFLLGYSNREGGEFDDEFLFRELELGFAGAVDPYTRADIIATIGKEDDEYKIDLEEAYLTFLQLPYGLQARAGKYRAEFGRSNPIHLHALPWTDYPFVIRRFFGDEGLSGTGAELSWLVPNKWNQYISLTYEVFNNDNDTLFAGAESDDFAHLMRLKTFRELSEASTLEFGGSFAVAPNDESHGKHRAMVEGLDFTYRWKPKEAGLYRSFLWQNEVMFAQTDTAWRQGSSFGMYTALEYQFARRWKLGTRFDYTELPYTKSDFERGYSAYLTFLQSEFLFWRLAYIHTDRNFREDGNGDEDQLLLQLNFTLGAHPAHRY